MTAPVKIAPSILSADFARLADEVKAVVDGGADYIHVDVMDGHFVPNLTIGPPVVKSLKKFCDKPLDTHLMIEHPERYIADFIKAGSAIISIHAEACPDNLAEVVSMIKKGGAKASVAIKPKTDLSIVEPVLSELSMVLLMTVEPGFGGQAFMPEVLPKIKALREIATKRKLTLDIEVDGGIAPATAPQVIAAGANVLVAGTAVYGAADRAQAIAALRGR